MFQFGSGSSCGNRRISNRVKPVHCFFFFFSEKSKRSQDALESAKLALHQARDGKALPALGSASSDQIGVLGEVDGAHVTCQGSPLLP